MLRPRGCGLDPATRGDNRRKGARGAYIGARPSYNRAMPSERALRAYVVARTLGAQASLPRAIARLGFVQADPIRAPARAQDLLLFQRVRGYREGDLDRRYAELDVEEDHFVNYGFLPRAIAASMHPRGSRHLRTRAERARAARVLDFVRERGEAHPRDVDARFALGTVTNYWGGSSSATTHLLDRMHFAGMVRVARREAGVRIYAPREHAAEERSASERAERLLAVAIDLYAPLPDKTLRRLATAVARAAPGVAREVEAALARARRSMQRVRAGGLELLVPEGEEPAADEPLADGGRVRLLAPFDPLAWDRDRFEALWGWTYRFEAYTPVAKRKLGYYALPLLFDDRVVGHANVARLDDGGLDVSLGFAAGAAPRGRAFARGLDEEIERLRAFLRPVSVQR